MTQNNTHISFLQKCQYLGYVIQPEDAVRGLLERMQLKGHKENKHGTFSQELSSSE